ncbi:hypothetical protein BC943DRAFT_317984 [Umbelopsis sp. AD052]|nr:hypothetical protein BC943DRAFT_317984 [Umbelopsis sp. AD052]
MAFLSGFVKSGLSLLGKDASAFPYTIGPKVEWYENQSIWSLHRGTKKVRHLMNPTSYNLMLVILTRAVAGG